MSIEADLKEIYDRLDTVDDRLSALEERAIRRQEREAVTSLETAAEMVLERQRVLEGGVTVLMIWRPEATYGESHTRFDGIEVYLQHSEATAQSLVEELYTRHPAWRFLITTAKWWGKQ